MRDVTVELGLPIAKEQWPDGGLYTPELTPGGVALLDYDNDGRLDIYQICHAPSGEMPLPLNGKAPNLLYHQEADGTFKEVAKAAGVDDPGFGHGSAVGDIDNDGDVDLYVTNFGPNRMYRNNGDGTFTDITEASGTAGDDWSSATSFFDYDLDGDLDLMVINFATYDYHKKCSPTGRDDDLDYCGPHEFPGLLDFLYRNNGDGTFTQVSEEMGIDTPARGWGIMTIDMTGDGRVDIYVANDEEPNQLWVQQEDGTFLDEAIWRGCAFNSAGKVEASMGAAYGDINNDGRIDMFMTHVTLETNTLFVSRGDDAMFDDNSSMSGLSTVDRSYTGWGCGFFDYDHDGDLDLAVANGRVAKGAMMQGSNLGNFWNQYGEPNFLFENDGQGKFKEKRGSTGKWGTDIEVTRGLAFGDIDNDGDIDLVTNSLANRLRIYRNVAAKKQNHWITVRAMSGVRDAVNAKITLKGLSVRSIGTVLPAYSYLSSNDPRVHFGLGESDSIESLRIDWPDGNSERYEVPGVDQHLMMRQGEGAAVGEEK